MKIHKSGLNKRATNIAESRGVEAAVDYIMNEKKERRRGVANWPNLDFVGSSLTYRTRFLRITKHKKAKATSINNRKNMTVAASVFISNIFSPLIKLNVLK